MLFIDERETYISKEKQIKKKTYEDSQIHLQKCYERCDASNCYRFCFNCSFNDCMTQKVSTSEIDASAIYVIR
jgi:hypothetical protein